MKLEDTKMTDSTTENLQLDSFLKEGWIIIGTDEFMHGDPPLKKTRYHLGHQNPNQTAPEWIQKLRQSLIEAQKR